MSRVHLTPLLVETVEAVRRGFVTRPAIERHFGIGHTAAWTRLRRGVDAGLLTETRKPGHNKPVVYAVAAPVLDEDRDLGDTDTAFLLAIADGMHTRLEICEEYPGTKTIELAGSAAKLSRVGLVALRGDRYHLTPAGRIVVGLLSRRAS